MINKKNPNIIYSKYYVRFLFFDIGGLKTSPLNCINLQYLFVLTVILFIKYDIMSDILVKF